MPHDELPGQLTLADIYTPPAHLIHLDALIPGQDYWIEESEDLRAALTPQRLTRMTLQKIEWSDIGREMQYSFSFPTATGALFRYIRTPRFHGRDWRVWDREPTREQREATPWAATP